MVKYQDYDGNPVLSEYIFMQYRLIDYKTNEDIYFESYHDMCEYAYPRFVHRREPIETTKDLIDFNGDIYLNHYVKVLTFFVY